MSVSQEELKKIAEKLSKIPGDNPEIYGNFSDILGYMELLEEVDTSWVTPTVSVIESSAHLRDDKVEDVPLSSAKELLQASNQKVIADQIILPNIMN